MDPIRTYIENFTRLSEQDWKNIKANFEEVSFNSDETILDIGDICRYFYFQEEGLIRFYLSIEGTEVSRAFLPAPCFFASRKSFLNQAPSREGIHCLESASAWRISFENYQKLANVPSWNRFMIALLNLSHDHMDNYLIDLLTLTAEEMYQNFIEAHPPEFTQRIPLKYLSTALGIAPQSLSRIRKKIISNLT